MKKHGSLFAFTALWCLVALQSCRREPVYVGTLDTGIPIDTSDNGGDPITDPCDPDSVYFSQQVLPILTSNCAKSGCHDAATAEEGIVLDNYTNTRNTGKIKINDPTDSKLYKVLIDNDPDDRMPPPPAAPLSQDQRQLILKWIQQGALNLSCTPDCDTALVTFGGSIQPLISQKCQGCHSGASPQGGLSLSNYTEIKATVNNGKLWGAITHSSGFSPMPYPLGNPKMSACDIRKVQKWIDAGAPNN